MAKNNLPTVNRRTVLKTGAAGIAGFGTLGVANADSTVEIVTARRRGEAIKTEKVPQGWYNRLQRARRAKRELLEEAKKTNGAKFASVTSDGPQMGSRRGHNVQITFETKEQMERFNAPDEKNGVGVNAGYGIRLNTRQCYDQDYSNVKGGAILDPDDLSPSESYWTAGCRVYNSNDNRRLLTCYHALSSDPDDFCDTDDVTDEVVDQNDDLFGPVTVQSTVHDSVLLRLDSSSPRNGISDNIVTRNYPVNGYYTQNGVANKSSLDKYGVTTCQDSMSIEGVDGTVMCSDNTVALDDLIQTETLTQSGDSGGPLVGLELINGTYYDIMGGILTGSANFNGTTYDIWPACYGIQNDLNVSFGGFAY